MRKKMKKFADGGLSAAAMAGGLRDVEMAEKLARFGLQPGTENYRIGQKTIRSNQAKKDLQELLPSGKAIGSALREKLDPQTLVDAANPAGAATRRIAEAARDAKMPSSYSDASNMKKGGRVAAKGEHSVQKQSKRGAEMVKMARGGGIEIRGKTRGKMC
jgi:hypothetical protein